MLIGHKYFDFKRLCHYKKISFRALSVAFLSTFTMSYAIESTSDSSYSSEEQIYTQLSAPLLPKESGEESGYILPSDLVQITGPSEETEAIRIDDLTGSTGSMGLRESISIRPLTSSASGFLHPSGLAGSGYIRSAGTEGAGLRSTNSSGELIKLSGYKPAPLNVCASAATSPRMKMKASIPSTPINPDKITELPLIKDWPLELVYSQGDLGSCTANSAAFVVRYFSILNSKSGQIWHVVKKAGTPISKKTVTTTENKENKENKEIEKVIRVLNPEILNISRLYQYYHTRSYEATLNQIKFNPKDDIGCSIIASILALDIYGGCPEEGKVKGESLNLVDLKGTMTRSGWKYEIDKFHRQPPPECYTLALDKNATGLNKDTPFIPKEPITNRYARIAKDIRYQDLSTPFRSPIGSYLNTEQERIEFRNSILYALERNHPIMIGTMLDNSIVQAKETGFVPTPNLNTFRPSGGHAMTIVGYGPYNPSDPTKRYYKVINSWGDWGDRGFVYFEDVYLNNVNKFSVEAYEIWFRFKS